MTEFRLVVAGGRDFSDKGLFDSSIERYWNIYRDKLSILSGMAKGADRMGLQWAKVKGVKLYEFPADWGNIESPGAVAKTNKQGNKYNALAGHDRNRAMAEFGDALLLFWDGTSPGSKNMLGNIKKLGKPYEIVFY